MLIEYKKANICQTDGKTVLEDVDFCVEEGAFIYLTGRVGSGKSSLLKTFYQELDIEEAEQANVLEFDLKTIRRKQIPALRRQIGIVFQDFQLLSDRSVFSNLKFVLMATGWKDNYEIESRIDKVLSDVGMLELKNCMPHELSGGEQQRVAIARAILNSPKLILADEPTASLDEVTAAGIMELLYNISKDGTAVVMTTHNMALIDKHPGIVYVCDNCRLTLLSNMDKVAVEEVESDKQIEKDN